MTSIKDFLNASLIFILFSTSSFSPEAGSCQEKQNMADISFSVGVVIPAAGTGERMNMSTPKQFCIVNGRPLICYTIECFHRYCHRLDLVFLCFEIFRSQFLIFNFKFNSVCL